MPYRQSDAQKRWLQRHFSEKHEEADKSCDCRGCDQCTGFVRFCKCNDNIATFAAALRPKTKSARPITEDLPQHVPPTPPEQLYEGEFPF